MTSTQSPEPPERSDVPELPRASAPPPGHAQAPPGARRGPACPRCGSPWQGPGLRPWYLQLVGAMFLSPVICCQCGHAFDAKKPHADLKRRQRNIGLVMNLFGAVGIALVVLYMVMLLRRHFG